MLPVIASRCAPLLILLIALSGLVPTAGQACGACDEDRIAATYDHAVVERAAARGKVMVLCSVQGRFDGARLSGAARAARGVDGASVRISAEAAALSFAIDPKIQSAEAAVAAVGRSLRAGTKLTLLRPSPALPAATLLVSSTSKAHP